MIDWEGPARQPCPECDRGPKDRSCGVTINTDGSGIAHCFRCEHTETRRSDAPRMIRAGRPAARPLETPKHEGLSEWARELWRAAVALPGTIGEAYLLARHCVIPPADGDLRFHPNLKHGPSVESGPALVALVTDTRTGEPLTLHRTWIRGDGMKAPFDPPRLLLGGHRKRGGCVRLWPDEAVTTGLGIAEGIETALSLAHAFRPVWALIDAGNLAALPELPGIEALTIAADNDPAGTAAADECAERWAAAGREVCIVQAEGERQDLNDLARATA